MQDWSHVSVSVNDLFSALWETSVAMNPLHDLECVPASSCICVTVSLS